MKKLFTFLLISMLALLPVSKAHAVIMVDEDFTIYDTGCFGDTTAAKAFSFDSEIVSFFRTDGVSINLNLKWGRGINDVEALGYPAGFPYVAGSSIIGGLQIRENTKAPYSYKTVEWEALEGEAAAAKTAYRWFYNQPSDSYNRPSDSLIIRVPADIDSILIEGGGSNTGYGILVYELDGGFDNGLYNAGNYGRNFNRIGFKPVNYGNKDSVDIVILAVHKDWFIPKTNTEWTDKGSYQFVNIKMSEADNYNKGERWGLFSTASLNRIKVFGKIQRTETPEFTGLLSGWTFKYMPLATNTGTPDVNALAPDDGSMVEAIDRLASDEGSLRSMLRVAPGMGNMEMGKECGNVQNVKLSNIGCNDTLYSSWGDYDKYFQLEINTTGYSDINLDFSFNLRGSSDSLAILYTTDNKNYSLLTKVATTTEFDGLVNVSLPVPITNCSAARVRFVPDHTDEVNGYSPDGELILANVMVTAKEAAKILYIHRDSKADEVFPLFAEYVATLIKSTAYSVNSEYLLADSLTADSLTVMDRVAPYDAIVMSSAVEAVNSFTPVMKYVIGQKPILNMSYEVYQAWNWAEITSGNTTEPVENSVVIADDYLSHPIFEGLNIENGKVVMFTKLDSTVTQIDSVTTQNDYFGVQGFVPATAVCGGKILASSGDMAVIHEIDTNPAAKYMMIGFSKNNRANLSDDAKNMIINAARYLLAGGEVAVNKIEKPESLRLFTQGGELYIQLEKASDVRIFSIHGQKVREIKGHEGLNTISLAEGLYIVGVNNQYQKVLVR